VFAACGLDFYKPPLYVISSTLTGLYLSYVTTFSSVFFRSPVLSTGEKGGLTLNQNTIATIQYYSQTQNACI